MRFNTILLLLILMAASSSFLSVAQTSDEMTRKLWDTAFLTPAAKKSSASRRRRSGAYRVATPNVPVDNVAPDTVVGVTIWRLRPANRTDTGERLIVHDDKATTEWLPERISATTKLVQGDKVRIAVEAARDGFLYVVNREQYADGSLGQPYLIFPTTRTAGGNNEVSIGKLVEIPDQDDAPPFFSMRKSRADHVAEVLSVLVTPTPLPVEITDKPVKLTETQVAQWERSWGSSVGRLDMTTVGQTWTRDEKEARTRALTTTAPAPQLVFYRPGAKSTEPMFVKLKLSYRK